MYKNQVFTFDIRNDIHNKLNMVLIKLQDKILFFKLQIVNLEYKATSYSEAQKSCFYKYYLLSGL